MKFWSSTVQRTATAAVAAGLLFAAGVPALAEEALGDAVVDGVAATEVPSVAIEEDSIPESADASTSAEEAPVVSETPVTVTGEGITTEVGASQEAAGGASQDALTVATDNAAVQQEIQAQAADEQTTTQDGFASENGVTYYYRDGQKLTGQVYDATTAGWYYFDEGTGAMVRGWKEIATQGKTVYYDPETGKMTYGESQVSGEDASHGRLAGWYLFDGATGAVREASMEYMENGQRWVYFTASGRRAEGELYLNDSQGHNGWYYFDGDNSGTMIHGFWDLVDGRTVYYDATTGIMQHGEAAVSDASGDGWRYFDQATGDMARGFKYLSEGNKTVFYNVSNGVMVHGEAYLSGTGVANAGWYDFDATTGAMQTGWKDLGGKTVYYNDQGVMAHGWLTVDGSTYYTDPVTGALVKGERYVDAASDGHVVGWYHFNETRATLDKGWKYLTASRKWVYYDPTTGAMVHENFTQDGVTYLVDAGTGAISNATVVPIRAAMQWMCDIAADSRYGYDQAYRWGERGDYDCSSLVISALRYAGFNTGSASYTGDMRSNLTAHGFRWITDLSQRQAGDILLNETYHTAMYLGNEWLVQASGNEHNGATGGQPGDQTGREIYERDYYNYGHGGWNGLLRYVG